MKRFFIFFLFFGVVFGNSRRTNNNNNNNNRNTNSGNGNSDLSGSSSTIIRDIGVNDELKVPNVWNSVLSQGGGRGGGKGKQKYIIELFIFIDYSVFQNFLSFTKNNVKKAREEIKYFFIHAVEGMKDIYSTALDGEKYSITFALNGIKILENIKDSNFTEGKKIKKSPTDIDGGEALIEFSKWVIDIKKKGTVKLPSFDLAIIFTRYTLGVFNGLAYPGQLCEYYYFSIDRMTSFSQTVDIFTHEIGHNIASHHDGTGNTCNYFHQFIMSAGRTDTKVDLMKKNQFTFSSCSRKYFNDHFDKLNKEKKNCILNPSPEPMDSASYLKILPGQKYSLNDQCVLTFGRGSYYCGPNDKDDFCWSLICFNPETMECENHVDHKPATGTTCGHKKWCYRNRCVHNNKAPATKNQKDECLYGDFKGRIRSLQETCQSLVRSNRNCYNKVVERLCCESCNKMRSSNKSCPYGNQIEMCQKDKCKTDGYKEKCCQTCSQVFVAPREPNCKDTDKYEECGLVTSWMCLHDNHIKHKCCDTCRRMQISLDKKCMYGNLSDVCEIKNKNLCKNQNFQKLCCSLCSKQRN